MIAHNSATPYPPGMVVWYIPQRPASIPCSPDGSPSGRLEISIADLYHSSGCIPTMVTTDPTHQQLS